MTAPVAFALGILAAGIAHAAGMLLGQRLFNRHVLYPR